MKALMTKLIIAALLGAIIAACGGGGGLAGIGGSGFISTGTVTGFGSVFVNGVEFETGSTVFEVEDSNGSQQDLRIGMVVQVEGRINDDGVSGTATRIRYGDQLEGPVAPVEGSTIIEVNLDATEKRFRVMGTNVIIHSLDTVFEGSGFDFDSIALNNAVEISGHYDENDVLRATYIKRTASIFNPTSTVEIEGSISNLSGVQFTLRNVNVDASSANLSDLPNGLQNGVYVEVKGTYSSTSNTITASQVEAEDIEFSDDGSKVSIEGYITRYVSNSDFDISGYRINASSAIFEPASLVLGLGIKVEAEGSISNGILNAVEIESEGGDAEIHALVTGAPNLVDNTFTLAVAPLESPVTVSVSTSTTLEDDELGIEPFTLSHLNNGDFVKVVGYETGTDSVAANKVKRLAQEDFILQGYATAATGTAASGSITILEVTIDFDGSTDFEDENDVNMDNAQIESLLSTINSTPTLIKIKDVEGDGTAEEIDIE